ncbi:predicted protein [Naegleria gruberi]|uniref:Predicted protein n=1 Tax=Naegleria gruberi TaxID=5762 RepID=D2VHH0_NAEGR|nr:uncharacterized protein NAEGRDRAFT_68324 [Naegleria gruberi]EFC43678.1 predicted protein [Naegleria gruberi]|eukprot:XP_002676422.1 predicted protein [Naegleria gruberi strain NEG-M]
MADSTMLLLLRQAVGDFLSASSSVVGAVSSLKDFLSSSSSVSPWITKSDYRQKELESSFSSGSSSYNHIAANLNNLIQQDQSSLESVFSIFSSSSSSSHQHDNLITTTTSNIFNYFPTSKQDLSIPFNITDDKEASESMQTVDSVLEYVGVSICTLTLLFYLITLIVLIRNRKNYFLSLWPSRVIALLGAIVHSFFGILVLLFQQPWWTEIKNPNTSYDSSSISNNIACRIIQPFEFFGFVLATCSVLFILSHTLTPSKKTDTHFTKTVPKSKVSIAAATTTTAAEDEELKDKKPKLARSTSVVDVVVDEESKLDLPENNHLTGVTIDDGSVKPLLRSSSASKNIVERPPSTSDRNHSRRKSESHSHKSPRSDSSSNKEEPIQISPRSRDHGQSFIKNNAPSVQEFQRTHLTINVRKENTNIFIRTLILTSFFTILQIASIIVDVVLSYNIQHHKLEFIYSHLTRYGGYCAFPLSSLLIYISFYFSFFITFNFYSVKLYRKLINKRLKRKVLACQIIITCFFTVFGIFGKSGEVLFTIIQSINVEPTSLLYDVLVRFFNVVNFICCDVLVCFLIIVYFVFIPLLETLETEKFYKTRDSVSAPRSPNNIAIVSSPTKLLIRHHNVVPENRV